MQEKGFHQGDGFRAPDSPVSLCRSTTPDPSPRAQMCLGHSGAPYLHPEPRTPGLPALCSQQRPTQHRGRHPRTPSSAGRPDSPRGTAWHPEPRGVCPRPGCLIVKRVNLSRSALSRWQAASPVEGAGAGHFPSSCLDVLGCEMARAPSHGASSHTQTDAAPRGRPPAPSERGALREVATLKFSRAEGQTPQTEMSPRRGI